MSMLPLEVHEVLEDEYVAMYGRLDLPASGNEYTEEQIVDKRWARRILAECGIPLEEPKPEDAESPLLRALNRFVAATSAADLRKLDDSPAMIESGKSLLDAYDELTVGTTPEQREELNRRIADGAFHGAVKPLHHLRLDNVHAALHARARAGNPRTALCISGGGIRSATFALGVIQGLASANILGKFDFLSTVSGGGYIGSWLSSWIRRHPRGVDGVQEDLQRADTAVAIADDVVRDNTQNVEPRALPDRKLNPEPEPLRHLRAFSNYLSPRLGLFSGDTWTIASIYLRNLLLNLLVLVPILACALAFPRMLSWILEFSKRNDRVMQPTLWAWMAAAFATIGFAYLGQKRPVEQGEKAQKKAGTITTDARFIVGSVVPLICSAVALTVFWARVQVHKDLLTHLSTYGAAIAAFVGMTLLPYILYYRRFDKSLAAERRTTFTGDEGFKKQRRTKKWEEFVAVFVALATMTGLLVLLALKVFDHPLRDVPFVQTWSPIERAGASALPEAQVYVCFAVPLILLVFFVQASIFVGLASRHNEDYDREWWGRAGAWLIAFALGIGVFSAISVFGPVGFYYAPVILASVGGGAGIIAALLGYSDKTPAKQQNKGEESTAAKAGGLASALTVPLFIVALLAAISLGSTWLIQQFQDHDPDHTVNAAGLLNPDAKQFVDESVLEARYTRTEQIKGGTQELRNTSPRLSLEAVRSLAHLQAVQHTSGVQVLSFFAVAAIGILLSRLIGVNKFSMQALYRNRIIRAYLGASRYRRDPDHFTGFDENDNLQMWELRPELIWPSQIHDASALVAELKDKNKPLSVFLWSALEPATRDAVERQINAVSVDALVQNLNQILLSPRDLAAVPNVNVPAWVKPVPGTIDYPLAMRNRAVVDAAFGEALLTPMVPPADAKDAPRPGLSRGPMHVVNTALNLTSGENLAWQQRMAASMTVSPYHSGSLYLGYRESREYGGEDGISLGTAVAISGAAASPNMGYHSSPTMAFLLTFFNIRLGAWLGNPGPRGRKSYKEKHPTSGLIPMFEELTGNSNDQSQWVYLSDGGHFENLGLYEMVLRRCHRIVLSDGGADPKCTFEDLGNAIRKIRTDLGVPIEIQSIRMAPRAADGKPVEGDYVAYATIRYSAIDTNAEDGELIYIKPGVYKGDYFPQDVYNYSQESLEFPHEPTSDQFFSESQFESYRALGRYAMNVIFKVDMKETASGTRLPVRRTFDSVGALAREIRPVIVDQPQQPRIQLKES